MLVILTEELSMKIFLGTIFERYYPNVAFQIIPHQGTQDLEKHIPILLRSYRDPNAQFIVIHDQDRDDCQLLKARLKTLCDPIRQNVVVRIACRELEAWYWGDLAAVANAFKKPELTSLSRKSVYRNPDAIVSPKKELERHVPKYQQCNGAKKIAEHMTIKQNTSRSFQIFLQSFERMAAINDE